MMKYIWIALCFASGLSVSTAVAQQNHSFGAEMGLDTLEDLQGMIEEIQQMFDPHGKGLNFQQFENSFHGFNSFLGGTASTQLGVKLGAVHPEVVHHLDLPPGRYQTIKSVVPGGAAEKAGLQALDIILQINDQDIMNAQQLVQWIAGKGAGEEVTVRVLRKGREEEFVVTLEEAAKTARGGLRGKGMDFNELFRQMQQQFDPLNAPQGPRNMVPEIEVEEDAQGNRTTRMRRSTRSSTAHTDQGRFTFKDDNGHRTFKVVDPDGEVAFEGPINTKKERAAVPVEFREQLEQMEQGSDIQFQFRQHRGPPKGPGKKRMAI